MRLKRKMILLTLVWASFSWALPSTELSVEEQQKEYQQPIDTKDVNFENENLILSPKPLKPQIKPRSKSIGRLRKEYYHIYQSAVSFRVALGYEQVSGSFPSVQLAGFSYQFPSRYSPHWEAGMDFTKTSNSYLWTAKKWTANEKGSYRPFYKAGVLHSWKSNEKMASLTNYRNYALYGGVGFEDILVAPQSVRLEIEAGLGFGTALIMFSLGSSWGL